jgi:hypothetical protein
MKKATFSAAAALLAAALAAFCAKQPESAAEPTSEIITVRYIYRDFANSPSILEDPTKERYRSVAHFFCYQDGRMVMFSPLRLDTAYFEPLTLTVRCWSIAPYTGPQEHYADHMVIRAEMADPTITRDDFDFTFRLRVLLP